MGRPKLTPARYCRECGVEIDRHNKSFCSRACRNTFYAKHPKEVEIVCQVCGKTFRAERKSRKYCSDKCNWKAKWERTKGQRSKNAKPPQGKVWNEKRQTILKEQHNQCWLCEKKLEEKFELHHMKYGDHVVNSDSLVVMCKSCHNRTHHVTVTLDKENNLEFHGVALDLLEQKLKKGE